MRTLGSCHSCFISGDKLVGVIKVFNIIPIVMCRSISFLIYKVLYSVPIAFSYNAFIKKVFYLLGFYYFRVSFDID